MLEKHEDREFAETLTDIFTFGAKIGYIGPDQLALAENHLSASNAPDILTKDLNKQLEADRITRLQCRPQYHFISSPLGLVPNTLIFLALIILFPSSPVQLQLFPPDFNHSATILSNQA